VSNFRLCDQIEWRLVDGEVVALDLRNSTYFSTNETGAVIWEALAEDGGCTAAALVGRVVEVFGVDEPTAATDVDRFLAELETRDLITSSGGEQT